jgi:uncharacterized phage protein (TIGR02220 family)
MKKSTNPLLLMLAKDKRMISYRPEFKAITGSVTSAILLQQIYYWWSVNDGKPFYKFKIKCDSKFYKDGDSWTEELGFSAGEFDTALDKIAVKVKKHGERPQDAIVWFWIDNDRRTYFDLNIECFSELLSKLYVGELNSVGRDNINRGNDGRFSAVNRENGFTTVTPENGVTKNVETDLRKSENPIYLQYSTEKTSEKTTTPNGGGGISESDIEDFEAQIEAKQSEAKKASPVPPAPPFCQSCESDVTELLETLNTMANRCYTVTGARAKANRDFLMKLLKQKYTKEEISAVIQTKCFEWVNNVKMSKFLRPETLFGSKFHSYLEEYNNLKSNPHFAEQFKKNINATKPANSAYDNAQQIADSVARLRAEGY